MRRTNGPHDEGAERAWTLEELAYLRAQYSNPELTLAEIATRLERTVYGVSRKALRLSLIRDPSKWKRPKHQRPGTWSLTRRRCMRCGTIFSSWGIGNRMCVRCRGHDAGSDFTLAY